MKKILNPFMMFIIGLILGVISRLLDIYTQNLGNIFSELDTRKKAMINIFPFCIGMLLTYYFVAFIIKGVYSKDYIIGWTIFALFSPMMAYFTWKTKEDGILPKLISVAIVLVSILSSIILFDILRIYDYIIDLILIYVLFFKKVKR